MIQLVCPALYWPLKHTALLNSTCLRHTRSLPENHTDLTAELNMKNLWSQNRQEALNSNLTCDTALH